MQLSEPILAHCQLDFLQKYPVKFESRWQHDKSHSRIWMLKCDFQNGNNLVPVSIGQQEHYYVINVVKKYNGQLRLCLWLYFITIIIDLRRWSAQSQHNAGCNISSDMQWEKIMMTSSNGNIFRVTGHLCGEFTGHRWINHTKASDAELWCFLWTASE